MVRCGACLRVFAADDNLLPSADLRTINIPVHNDIEEDEEPEALDEQLPIAELETEDEIHEEEEATESILTLDMADSVPNRLNPSISTSEPFWELIEEDSAPEGLSVDDSHEVEEPTPSAQPEDDTEEAEERVEDLVASLQDDTAPALVTPKAQPPAPPTARDEHAQIRSRMTAIDFDDERLSDNSDARSYTRFSAEEIEGVSDAETPLELDWQETLPRGGSQSVLWLLSLLLILGIAGQFLWFNKDSLSKNASLRPLLDGFCATLRCELPPLVNIRAIRSDTLLVRSHNEIANALSVNFQFQNDASFAQPFPGLALRFMDADDTIVAERHFAPAEYLPEAFADLHLMPPGSPVQVRLDILDPGGKAVNYELSFYVNKPN